MTTAKSASASNLEALKLTPNMLAALKAAKPGEALPAGATRGALMRRGLLHGISTRDSSLFGTLTPAGEVARADALLAEVAPEPELPTRERGASLAEVKPALVERGAELKLAQAALEDDLEARTIIGAGSERKPIMPRPIPRVRLGDTVRIHTGTRLYSVERLDREVVRYDDSDTLELNPLALLKPCDPEDDFPAHWVAVDLLHVVPPVAHLKTLPTGDSAIESLAEVPVVVTGAGWFEERGPARQVATIRGGASRLPYAALLPWPEESRVEWAAGCLRIGDSIVVDGRLWRVTWDGGPAEPVLVAENWHGFQAEPYQL